MSYGAVWIHFVLTDFPLFYIFLFEVVFAYYLLKVAMVLCEFTLYFFFLASKKKKKLALLGVVFEMLNTFDL